jgi:peptidoglycan/LPS O-acetylase OafA/YrhL
MLLKSEPIPPGDASRIAALDMLRAVAVFLVIGYHTAWRFQPDASDALALTLKRGGWIGVDIFFAISGFMITTVLLRDAGDVRGFFVRRFYRIFPVFIVAIVAFAIATVATAGASSLGLMWSPALLLNGWTIPFFGRDAIPYTITWSLSVEETAYLILGLACVAGPRMVRLALLTFVVTAPLVRIVVLTTQAFAPQDLYFFVPARLDSIALGGLAAFSTATGRRPRWQAAALGLAMVVSIWILQYPHSGDPRLILLGFTVFPLIVSMFIRSISAMPAIAAVHPASQMRAFFFRPIATFGKVSYFVYLFHIFVLEALLRGERLLGISLGFWLALLLASLIVFAMAAVSWKYFEYPLIRRSRRETSRIAAVPMVTSSKASA